MTGLKTEINTIAEIQADIEAIKTNAAIYKEINFNTRTDAIDFLEFHVIDRINSLLEKTTEPERFIFLKQEAEAILSQLEKINDGLFRQIRKKIRAGDYKGKAFNQMIEKYTGGNSPDSLNTDEPGYDNLDVFINGLLSGEDMPEKSIEHEPGMVFYQKTPARVAFEMIAKAQLTKDDVFFDLGCGLGQVCILVNLLTEAISIGVEFEPAYCNYARVAAAGLNLKNIDFRNKDAREDDYSPGTVFFMYTPFEGEMLQEMLEILRKESQKKMIRIFTYGPCTDIIARQNWLSCANYERDNPYRLSEFQSS